jgi:hypothetical protein
MCAAHPESGRAVSPRTEKRRGRSPGTVEAYFSSWTDFYNSFDGSSVVDVAIKASRTSESLTYNLNKCRILQATPHAAGRERLIATVEFESYHDTTATESMQVVLVNNDATP